MKASREFRRSVSYHEAGHAVVAHMLGLEIAGVDMTANNNRIACVRIESAVQVARQAGGGPADMARSLYADLMVALAGMEAQQLAGHPVGDDFTREGPFGDDTGYATWCAACLVRIQAGLPMFRGPDEPKVLRPGDPLHTATVAIVGRATAETKAMLEDNWRAVMLVAGALTRRDRLSVAELEHVIAHGWPAVWETE